jgi:hypothetical protein
MARERSISKNATAWLWLAFFMLAVSSAESAWHVRNAFSMANWFGDWFMEHVIPIAGTSVIIVGLILWKQTRLDKSFVRLESSDTGSKSGIGVKQ